MKIYVDRNRRGQVLNTRYDVEDDGDQAVIDRMITRGDKIYTDGDGRYWWESAPKGVGQGGNDPLRMEAFARRSAE